MASSNQKSEINILLEEYDSNSEQTAVTNLIEIHEKLLSSKWFVKTKPTRQQLINNLKELDLSPRSPKLY